MKKIFCCFAVFAAVLLSLPTAGNAKAPRWMMEQYIDVYTGQASYQDKRVTATTTNISIFWITEETATRNVSFSDSNVFGGRWGFWLREQPRYGFAVDLSFLGIDGQDVNISAMPLSFMMFYRHPLLTSEEFIYGRVQPYAGLGISLISANFSVDFRPDISRKVDGSAEGTAIDLRAGLRLSITKKIGIFAEMRHLNGSIRKDDEAIGLFIFGVSETLEEARTGISSQQFLVGISIKL